MLSVSATVSKESLARCKAAIDRKIAEKIAKAGTKIYNLIVGGKINQDFPVWSGAYIASWNYNFGSVDTSHKALPTNKGGVPNVRYSRPRPQAILANYSAPYTPLFISNSVPHAYKVEFIGTPKHAEPWMVATNAINAFRYGV